MKVTEYMYIHIAVSTKVDHLTDLSFVKFSYEYLLASLKLERKTIMEVTKSRPLNDVNTFKVNHPLWAGPRTWQTFVRKTHMKHIYTSKQHKIQIHMNKSN